MTDLATPEPLTRTPSDDQLTTRSHRLSAYLHDLRAGVTEETAHRHHYPEDFDDESWGPDILQRARDELERAEAADMAYYRRGGWPAGGAL